jgi:ABC-2 type transport system ATP-binding protein
VTDAIDITGLTKRYGELTAVDDVSFTVRSGRVVGLLGRNGAGKTTTLRMLLGLARPTAGSATIFGHPYAQLPGAAHRVGVSIDGIGPSAASGRADLRIWAQTCGLPRTRVDDVLEQVGLASDAHRRLRDYSQGMRQRHALATALLADPELLILDEPANGLDPDGIRWLRELLRSLADEGRTVLVSSHILAEVEQMADDIVILQKTLRYSGTAAELTRNGELSLESRFFDLADPTVKEDVRA